MTLNRKEFLRGGLALGLGMVAAPAVLRAAEKKIRFATEGSFPPYNQSTPSGKIIGYEPDIIAEIAKRQGFEYELVAQDWNGMFPGLTGNKYDAIIDGVTITAKRQEVIAFTLPYTTGGSSFAVMTEGGPGKLPGTGTTIDISGADAQAAIEATGKALKGKTIGVQISTIQSDFLDKYLASYCTIRKYQTGPETYADLTAGRVDAVMASNASMSSFLKKHKQDAAMEGYTFLGGVMGNGAAIGLRKGDDALKTTLDAGLSSMIKDGTLKALSIKWFGIDIAPKSA